MTEPLERALMYLDTMVERQTLTGATSARLAIREALDAEGARQADPVGLREAVEAVVAEHRSEGEYARFGGDALLHDIQDILASLPAQPVEPGPLDVERLARAYAEAGYGPVLTDDEWADVAAEYARLSLQQSEGK